MTEDIENFCTLFERSESLPVSAMRDLASIAALAYDLAVKAELGDAGSIDLSTLTCHCKVLAEDLYEMASGKITQEQIDQLVGKDWFIGADDRWHNDKTGESMERIPWLD